MKSRPAEHERQTGILPTFIQTAAASYESAASYSESVREQPQQLQRHPPAFPLGVFSGPSRAGSSVDITKESRRVACDLRAR